MSLFLDGPPSSIEDLTDQDSGLLDVCRIEQIDASVKIKLAHNETGVQIESLFDQQRTFLSQYWGQPQFGLRNVVVTPTLSMWHTWHTLSLVYRDAYFNQLNDRFQAKWNEYRSLAETAKNRLREVGVALVFQPLPRPNSPVLTATPAAEVGGTFYFSATVLNAAGEESAPSPVGSIQISDGNAVDVQSASQAPNAQGWNVYAGGSPETLYRQNDAPLSTDGDWLFYPSLAAQSGQLPGKGQSPNLIQRLPRLLPRG
jgi:hypothetical protein